MLVIAVSTDIVYWKGRYIETMHLRTGEIVNNVGYVYSQSAGPLIWEVFEI